jgi:hypothetical protein
MQLTERFGVAAPHNVDGRPSAERLLLPTGHRHADSEGTGRHRPVGELSAWTGRQSRNQHQRRAVSAAKRQPVCHG